MILLLHHRYRHAGGEERAVEDLAWLIREHLGEDVEVLERDSAASAAATRRSGLVRGGLHPEEVAAAVRRTGARVVHAHNVNPTFGPRALEAARAAGARVVLHLHNYRLVCAVRYVLHARRGLHALPRPQHAAGAEAQLPRRLTRGVRRLRRRARAVAEAADDSGGRDRRAERVRPRTGLRDARRAGRHAQVLGSVQRTFASARPPPSGEFVLAAGRLTPEKGFADVVEACSTRSCRW